MQSPYRLGDKVMEQGPDGKWYVFEVREIRRGNPVFRPIAALPEIQFNPKAWNICIGQ